MFDDLLARQRSRTDYPPATAQIVSVTPRDVFVAPLGGDRQHPIGPCLGKKTGLNVGDIVLLIFTDGGPWIAGKDE